MRLIDADAFSEQYGNYYAEEGPAEGFIGTVGDLISKQPTIEAEPVRHGRWIPNGKRSVFGDLEYLCSECSRKITVNWAVKDPSEYNAFCSGCGARMSATDTNFGGKGGADKL